MGASLLLLFSLVLTATMIGMVLATPLVVLFSPVLIPAAFVFFLTFAGFVSSSGFELAAMAALRWIYNYVAGKHSPKVDKVDYARNMIVDKARIVKDRAGDYDVFRRVGHLGLMNNLVLLWSSMLKRLSLCFNLNNDQPFGHSPMYTRALYHGMATVISQSGVTYNPGSPSDAIST